MKTFTLLFIWFIVELILWLFTVILVVSKSDNDNAFTVARNNKYLRYVKTISFIIAVLFSLGIGYLLNS